MPDMHLADADHARRERFLLVLFRWPCSFVRIREPSKASELTHRADVCHRRQDFVRLSCWACPGMKSGLPTSGAHPEGSSCSLTPFTWDPSLCPSPITPFSTEKMQEG